MVNLLDLYIIKTFKEMDGIETFLVDEESLSDEGGIIWWVSSLSPRV